MLIIWIRPFSKTNTPQKQKPAARNKTLYLQAPGFSVLIKKSETFTIFCSRCFLPLSDRPGSQPYRKFYMLIGMMSDTPGNPLPVR